MLKTRLPLLLLLGALIGLFGQGIAYAAGQAILPRIASSHTTTSAIGGGHARAAGMECADMANTPNSKPEHPCKGLTLACIAQMGCVMPMTCAEATPLAARSSPARLAASLPTLPALSGLVIVPEPEPPSV